MNGDARPWWAARRSRWRRDGLVVVVRTVRLMGAAVVAYLVSSALFPGTQPLTGPLTALLVVQATLFSTLRMGVLRVASVVSGVLVAVFVSDVVGLSWWSLGAVIGAALAIGQLLRLREQLLEVPISAMLILGIPAAATARVAETLIGAGVGVLVNVVFPPALRSRSAGEAVEEVAVRTADLLTRAARELPRRPSREEALRWLQETRDLARYVDAADRAVLDLRDSRRLNPRAIREMDTEPVLRSGLDALERSIAAMRGLFRAIADGLLEERESIEHSPELFGAMGVLLEDLADALRAYGALVRADAEAGGVASDAALAEALDALGATRAHLTELLIVDAGKSRDHWMLSGSLLADVDRVLRELDLELRARQREQWRSSAAQRAVLGPLNRMAGRSRPLDQTVLSSEV
jgi:hypothetical protein